jgi:5-methylcytosine-specific restriction endonuclease McrA
MNNSTIRFQSGYTPVAARDVLLMRRTARPVTVATRSPKRDTGPAAEIRQQIQERDHYSCVACGRPIETDPWRSIQHRVARGVGGRDDLTNLISLCGAGGCHARAESRDDDAHRLGYWLRHNEDPAAVPIWLITEFRSRWVLLDGNGRRDDYEPDDPDDPRWAPPPAA